MFYTGVKLTSHSQFLLESDVVRRMFGVSRDVIIKEWRNLLHNLYFSSAFRAIKLRSATSSLTFISSTVDTIS